MQIPYSMQFNQIISYTTPTKCTHNMHNIVVFYNLSFIFALLCHLQSALTPI